MNKCAGRMDKSFVHFVIGDQDLESRVEASMLAKNNSSWCNGKIINFLQQRLTDLRQHK